MDHEEAKKRIRSFIAAELLEGNDAGLDENTPLLELGVIDSMGIVQVTTFLEKELGTKLPPEELTAQNFSNLAALADLVVRLRG
ncbi:MAG TPA: acyl carrier protein [Polyangiaceae bacterium]|jgi:acyl carrier protein